MSLNDERSRKRRKTNHETCEENNTAFDMDSKKQSYLGRILETACNLFNNEENLSPLASLANLATDKKAVTELLSLGIGKKLSNLLAHKNLKIQEMAAGVFRNLSTTGGMDTCLRLVKDGLLSQISIALKEDIQLAQSLSQDKEEIITQVVSSMNQLLALLCNLCEASDEAMKLFNEVKLMPSLIALFMMERAKHDLTLSVAQCFATVTEENDEALNYLANDQSCLDKMVQILVSVKETNMHWLLAATISGVLLNVRKKLQDVRWMHVLDLVLQTIDGILQADCQQPLKDIVSSTFNNAMVEDCTFLLSAKQTSMEVLANIVFPDDGEDEMEISDDDPDYFDSKEDQNDSEPSTYWNCVKRLILSKALAEKVFFCTQYADQPEMILLKERTETNCLYQSLVRIQKSALFCLGNMIDNSLWSDDVIVQNIWKNFSERLCANFEASESDLLLGLTTCLRAITLHIADSKCQNFLKNENNLVKMVESWYRSTKDLQIRFNLLKVFGAVGKIFSEIEDGKVYLEQIATVLFQELKLENPLMIVVEALDAVFDAFGEDGVSDHVLSASGMGRQLCLVATWIDQKIKSEKRLSRENKKIARDAKMNLDRFIEYKKCTC
ncbi:HEAT repeat-containing protein 3-like [Rhopilema esculentum]|uniref:HEAT repeat-containing protein 3-like n=1 Tax=Rhopilema esculentum TaxID=499914 RepID=UPI0031DA2C05